MSSRRGYDDRDPYYRDGLGGGGGAPLPVRTREREYEERGTYNRPTFLNDDYGRPTDSGAMVVRQREEETFVRQRPRSLSPVRVHRERFIDRSPTPPSSSGEYTRTRFVERERERERHRSPSPQLRARVVETRERQIVRERSPSPPPVRVRERYVERERERERSPSPIDRVRIRNIEQREIVRAPSPAPLPVVRPPSPIRAPAIHQEVITHHRHIDHGFERAHVRVPTPPPPVRQNRVKETDIDIYTSRNNTEVDITRRESNTRSPPVRSQPIVRREREYVHDDSYLYEQERDRLRVSDTTVGLHRRRSMSARPPPERAVSRTRIRESESEADYYARRTNERAVIGEAYNGATKEWSIVDVPPGTERVRMDGVGGGSQEISWQKYNGVRRSKFIPEREREGFSSASTSTVRDRVEVRDEIAPARETSTLEIDISSRRRGGGREFEREREYERITEDTSNNRRAPMVKQRQVTNDLWTEITKDLVAREAIEELGYDFEETEFFYYIIQYLRYEDVLELVQLSETIRRERQHRVREIEWERQQLEVHDRRHRGAWGDERGGWESDRERGFGRGRGFDDERVTEREVIYASTGSGVGGRRRY